MSNTRSASLCSQRPRLREPHPQLTRPKFVLGGRAVGRAVGLDQRLMLGHTLHDLGHVSLD